MDVTVRVKTFEDACEELGSEHPLVIEYKTISTRVGGLTPDIIAYLKLRIIVAALNEGWEPQFTEDEWRWYGWYYLVSKEEYDKMNDADKSRVVCRGGCNAHGGVAGSYASNALSYAYSYYGSRLAFKSEELAEYAARQFIDLFADFCFRPE
ncbi:MAG: hypothetical protein Q4E59_00585 [Bacteroidales bacterium]|nr:hypothetical protein [Bacteroidales bacterium]